MYVQSSRNPVQKVLLLWLTHPTHVYDDVCNACRDTYKFLGNSFILRMVPGIHVSSGG